MDKTIALPGQTRAASFVPSSFNADKRTVDVIWSTGAAVRRYDWSSGNYFDETLSLDRSAVDLGRMNGGAPVLNTHNSWDLSDVIGVVEPGTASVDGTEGRATLRFSDRADIAGIVDDIRNGIIRNVSVGYQVSTYEETRDAQGGLLARRAVAWMPYEVSMCPMGADAGAGTRAAPELARQLPCRIVTIPTAGAAADTATAEEHRRMTTETEAAAAAAATATRAAAAAAATTATDTAASEARAVTAERARVAQIRDLASRAKLPADVTDKLCADGVTVDAARAHILDHLVGEQAKTPATHGALVQQGSYDERTVRVAGMTEALLHRTSAEHFKLSDKGREFRGLSLLDMARECAEGAGIRTRGMGKLEIVRVAFNLDRGMVDPGAGLAGPGNGHTRSVVGFQSVSDFPSILADVANKTLRRMYDASPRTFLYWASEASAPDFKNMNRDQLSGAPSLLEVRPGGEFKEGAFTDHKEQYALLTYGRKNAISRQSIINDDLAAFTRIPMAFGRAAADLQSDLVYAILTSASGLGPNMSDGHALFDTTNHGNYTSSGTAISIAALSVGRAALRTQTGLEGRILNLAPAVLLTPSAIAATAQQFTSQAYLAAAQTAINPYAEGFSGSDPTVRSKLTPVEEGRLDASSTTAWYMIADKAQIDTVEYAFLEGEAGPFIETRLGFDVDGMEVRCRLDFASAPLDHRGFYKNVGA